MKTKIFIFSLIALPVAMAFGQTKNYIDQPYIETTGVADTLITPDEIYLNIVISEKDSKDKISVEQQENEMVKVLKKLGINTEKDLMLNDLSSNFKKYLLKQQDVLKAKNYTLKVYDAVTAGKVFLELEKIDIANVSLDHTAYSKIEQLKLELRSKAVANAKQQATYLTAPLDQKVGAAIHIADQSEFNNMYAPRAEMMSVKYKTEDVYAPADIEVEKIKVQSRAFVVFKLAE